MKSFKPPLLLKSCHLQTIISSSGIRKPIVKYRARNLRQTSTTHILDCGNGIRLQGEYAAKPNNQKGLVILIHGWLGGTDSLYLLSAGSMLLSKGYNIFRLNLRDHGNSEHLNKELFNSTRIDEVVNAVKAIQLLFPHQRTLLAGFSLGGNFCLRVAARAPDNNIQLQKVAAICPVINPHKTNRNLHDGFFLYHQHFRKQWKRALLAKLQHFPEHGYQQQLKNLNTLDAMNAYFVPSHTSFDKVDTYLQGYSIGGDQLAQLQVPCHIISSLDDPVILAEDLTELADNDNLTIELTRYGGHCGYLDSLKLTSWIDQRLLAIFAAS